MDGDEPAATSDEVRAHETRRPSVFAVALAVGWLVIPGVQYLGTVQRTEMQLEGSAPFEPLAALDLTYLYLALLAATIVFAALQVTSRRRAAPQPERP